MISAGRHEIESFRKIEKPPISLEERKGILAVLLQRDGQGIDSQLRTTIDAKVARGIAKAIEDSGIRPSQKSRRIGDFVLGALIADGPVIRPYCRTRLGEEGFPASSSLHGRWC